MRAAADCERAQVRGPAGKGQLVQEPDKGGPARGTPAQQHVKSAKRLKMRVVADYVCAQVWGPAGKVQLGGGQEADKGGPARGSPAQGPSLGVALKTRSVQLGCLLLVFQQLSGINAIVYFSSSVFAQVRSL